MIDINSIDSIPQNAVLSKKGMFSNEFYIDSFKVWSMIGTNKEILFAKNNDEEIIIKITSENGGSNRGRGTIDFLYMVLKYNNSIIKKESIYADNNGMVNEYGIFVLKTDNLVEILTDIDDPFISCIPKSQIQLKPMPKIDKLIDSSSFENVSTKLQEINNLLKVSSDNLKTIMDANNLMYESTDNFSALVQKLNNETSSLLVNGKEFNSIVKQNQSYGDVKSIYFIKRDIMPTNGIDVSAKKDKSIMLYSEDKINDSSMPEPKVAMYTHIVIVSKNKIMFNKDCSNMFEGLYFNYFYFENIDTSNVENMSCMFKNSGLSGISNDSIDTSSVLDTSNMFEGCNRLCGGITIKNPNLTKFDNMFLNAGGGIADIFVIDYVDEKTKQIAAQMKNTGGTNIFIKGDDVPTSP